MSTSHHPGSGARRGAATTPDGGTEAESRAPTATDHDGAAVGQSTRRPIELAPVYGTAIRSLTWGFRLGAALLTVGLALAAARRERLNHEAEPFAEVIPAVLDGRAAGIVDLAILWLMATPVATVILVGIGFLRAGDRRYALVSLLVLAILGVSIALALSR